MNNIEKQELEEKEENNVENKEKQYCYVRIVSKYLDKTDDLVATVKCSYGNYYDILNGIVETYNRHANGYDYYSFPIICEKIAIPIVNLEYYRDIVTGKIYRGPKKNDDQKSSKEIVLKKACGISKTEVCEKLKELSREDVTRYVQAMENLEVGTLEYYQKWQQDHYDEDEFIRNFAKGNKR